jgi:hypothetical protein
MGDYFMGQMFTTNEAYQEILRLHQMLDEENVQHTLRKCYDGWQIVFPEDGKNRVMDAIQHFGSYGAKHDLLEIAGLLTEEEKTHGGVLGHLTAENVYKRIMAYIGANGGYGLKPVELEKRKDGELHG